MLWSLVALRRSLLRSTATLPLAAPAWAAGGLARLLRPARGRRYGTCHLPTFERYVAKLCVSCSAFMKPLSVRLLPDTRDDTRDSPRRLSASENGRGAPRPMAVKPSGVAHATVGLRKNALVMGFCATIRELGAVWRSRPGSTAHVPNHTARIHYTLGLWRPNMGAG